MTRFALTVLLVSACGTSRAANDLKSSCAESQVCSSLSDCALQDRAVSQPADRQSRAALIAAMRRFKVSQPGDSLLRAPAQVRRNRGAAAYLTSLLASSAIRPRILKHFSELVTNRHRLTETATRLDRDSGKYYRDSLRFDVLRFLVDVIGDGKSSFRFSASEFREAYYSRAEGRAGLFDVTLPTDYSPTKTYPLVVQIFGSRSFRPSRERPFIRIRPNGRGVWGYRSMSRYDVMQAIAQTKLAYKIDADRIYLTGTSAGATGAMHAAAYRQDLFAGVIPLVAFGNDLPLENFRNLPIRCEHGVNDWTSAIGNVRAQFQRLKTLRYDAILNEHPRAGHGIGRPPRQTLDWLFKLRRNSHPAHVVHSCEHPRDGKAYWLGIREFVDPHKVARVEAKRTKRGLNIVTRNVRRFRVEFAPGEQQTKRALSVDGLAIPLTLKPDTKQLTFVKRRNWQVATPLTPSKTRRRVYAAGAAANLFQGEPLLVIYGTGAETPENLFLRQAANSLARSGGPHFKAAAVRFPVRPDSQLRGFPLESHNLVLVGDANTNSYLRKIASKLPYTVKNGVLAAGGRKPLTLAGSVLSFQFYNPEHPDRLIYVVSPHLKDTQRRLFLKNPRHFLAGSHGFKMIDQPDLLVRGADLRIRREMQFGAGWKWLPVAGEDKPIPRKFSNRIHLAVAHMKVMRKAAGVDFALWWGPEDKGAFGGYDFNWLETFDPTSYTLADYRIRRRETECLRAVLSGRELRDIFDRWIAKDEILIWPVIKRTAIRADGKYGIVIPMDLVVKLGNRRKTLSNVAAGPVIFPQATLKEVFSK